MSHQPSTELIEPYLKIMAEKKASDMYFITGAQPFMKLQGRSAPVAKNTFKPGQIQKLAYSVLNLEQIRDFEINLEFNLGFTLLGVGRFRLNIFVQRSEVSMVIRYIKWDIPTVEDLGLPPEIKSLVMKKTGLILVVGAAGSGKSSTLAAMLNHRNAIESGHILTLEDPIEYIFNHKKSVVSQREVGIDTLTYENGLREALREAPDVIMIGESRDAETMQAAINFADTGHLCVTTLHAVNANQAMDRILNMFSAEMRNQLLMDLSANLKAVISQRLIPGIDGQLACAVEILVNTPFVTELIREGNFHKIKDVMEKGGSAGMLTFDQSLYNLYTSEKISIKQALTHADSSTNLEWRINFGGAEKPSAGLDEDDALVLPSEQV